MTNTYYVQQYIDAIIVLYVIVAMVSAYLVIRLPHGFIIKFILVPLLVALGYIGATSFDAIIGRPLNRVPEGTVQVLSYRIGKQGTDKYIEVWCNEKGGHSRLYHMPYSAETAQVLENMMREQGQTGQPRKGKFSKKGAKKMDGAQPGDSELRFEVDEISVQDKMPAKPSDHQ